MFVKSFFTNRFLQLFVMREQKISFCFTLACEGIFENEINDQCFPGNEKSPGIEKPYYKYVFEFNDS